MLSTTLRSSTSNLNSSCCSLFCAAAASNRVAKSIRPVGSQSCFTKPCCGLLPNGHRLARTRAHAREKSLKNFGLVPLLAGTANGVARSPLSCRSCDRVGPRAQLLGSRTDLASKQEIRLLDTASCDQLIREFGKGSSNGDGKALVSTFAHVSAPWLFPATDGQRTGSGTNYS